MQATYGGFGLVNADNVFKVCDQPHPLLVETILKNCRQIKVDEAYEGMQVRSVYLTITIADDFGFHLVLSALSTRTARHVDKQEA